jgi:2-methylcitrate dehydratase PrpD
MTKALHAGNSARNGVVAAVLAKMDLPPMIILCAENLALQHVNVANANPYKPLKL